MNVGHGLNTDTNNHAIHHNNTTPLFMLSKLYSCNIELLFATQWFIFETIANKKRNKEGNKAKYVKRFLQWEEFFSCASQKM